MDTNPFIETRFQRGYGARRARNFMSDFRLLLDVHSVEATFSAREIPRFCWQFHRKTQSAPWPENRGQVLFCPARSKLPSPAHPEDERNSLWNVLLTALVAPACSSTRPDSCATARPDKPEDQGTRAKTSRRL